jgi:predicted ABC-type ATPase
MPEIHIIAGANGSGKSTISKSISARFNIPIIDPDAIARELNAINPKKAAVAAGRIALERVQSYIDQSIDFGLETTLSGNSYIKLMKVLREANWTINLVYIGIDLPEINIRRVEARVLQGGHNVPPEDIRRRYYRSLDNLIKAVPLANVITIHDNSEREFITITTVINGILTTAVENNSDWYRKIEIYVKEFHKQQNSSMDVDES